MRRFPPPTRNQTYVFKTIYVIPFGGTAGERDRETADYLNSVFARGGKVIDVQFANLEVLVISLEPQVER